jgi:MraZ protein
MFRGQYVHSIDAKGRVSVPARLRDGLLEGGASAFILTPDPFEPCLHLYAMQAWEEFERKIAALPSLDPNVMRFRRVYVSAAIECEIDRAGRVLVPPHLREHAELNKEVLFAGTGLKIELWSKARWDAAVAMSPEDLEAFKRAVMEQIRV